MSEKVSFFCSVEIVISDSVIHVSLYDTLTLKVREELSFLFLVAPLSPVSLTLVSGPWNITASWEAVEPVDSCPQPLYKVCLNDESSCNTTDCKLLLY